MAQMTRPLTNNEILEAKPQEKDFTLYDDEGLFLLVKTSGKKLWRFTTRDQTVPAEQI